MKKVLILAILLVGAPVVACDCKPDGGMSALSDGTIQLVTDRAAEKADDATSCGRAQMLGEFQNATSLHDPVYPAIHAEYWYWSDRCERFLEGEIDRAN